MKREPKGDILIAAFDWGRSIGEVNRANGAPRGTAKGTGLRGATRDAFTLGLIAGFESPRKGA